MAKKKFVLRMEEDIYEAIEKWAQDEFRSANGQIEWIIQSALKKENRYKEIKDQKTINES